jgi:hypothetical protein
MYVSNHPYLLGNEIAIGNVNAEHVQKANGYIYFAAPAREQG